MMPTADSPRGAPAEEALHNLIAGALEHLACHVQTGRAKSALLAAMLLDHLARDPDVTVALRLRAQHLRDVLEDRLPELPVSPPPTRAPAGDGDAPPRRPPRGPAAPWLTWENLGGGT